MLAYREKNNSPASFWASPKVFAFGKHYDHYPTVLIVNGLGLAKTGQLDEGEKLLRDAVELRNASLPKEHFWVAIANSALGECLMMQKRFNEAGPLLTESYNNLRNSQGVENPRTQLAKSRLDKLYENWTGSVTNSAGHSH